MYMSVHRHVDILHHYQLLHVSARPALFPFQPSSPSPLHPTPPRSPRCLPLPLQLLLSRQQHQYIYTCIVPATINSSLTLCVDFVKYPEHAKRHAELDLTNWKQVLPGEENICSVTAASVPALQQDTAIQRTGAGVFMWRVLAITHSSVIQ